MVWIKVSDTIYYNSELITSIYVTSYEQPSCEQEENTTEVSIVFKYSELEDYSSTIKLWASSFKHKYYFGNYDPDSIGACFISPDEFDEKDIDYEGNYNEKMSEKLFEKAKEILVKLLNELEFVKKNGDTIFDLEAFLKPYNTTN